MALTKVTTGTISDGAIESLKGRNLIINGAMQVAQRGTSTTAINEYLIDRWRSYGGPMTHTFSQVDDIATYPVTRYALKVQRTAGDTNTSEYGIATGLESIDSYPLTGETVTLSFKARCGADFSPTSNVLRSRIVAGSGTDASPVAFAEVTNAAQNNTLTTSVQTFTQSATISSSAKQVAVRFDINPTGTAGADDWFEVTEVQLELGSTATPFEHETYGETLAKCQRYYQSFGGDNNFDNYAGRSYGTGSAFWSVPLSVPLRTSPTLTFSGTIRAFGSSGYSDSTSLSVYGYTSGRSLILINSTGFSGLTDNRSYNANYIGGTAAVMELDAEL